MADRQRHRFWHRHVLYRVAWVLVALGIGFGIGLAALGFAPVLAGACPACFGFRQIAPNVYSELTGSTTSDEILRRLSIAEARVENVFGPGERPRILICFTDSCHNLMGGSQARALTFGHHLFYLSPRGHDTEIIAHELVHIVVHRDIGLQTLAQFPAWVDEGIAVYVSQDPRFDLNPESCEPGQGPLPTLASDWRHTAGYRALREDDVQIYGQAGCRVAQWLKRHPVSGMQGLIKQHLPAT